MAQQSNDFVNQGVLDDWRQVKLNAFWPWKFSWEVKSCVGAENAYHGGGAGESVGWI